MNNDIRKAKEELDKISQDEREIRLAELREKAVKDEMAIRDSGYKEGKEEGLEEGIKQGKISKQLEIAKKLKEENVDINLISKVTNLKVEEINKI